MAGSGFTVRAGELAAGGRAVVGLLGSCEKIASDAVTAITGMSEASSGHAGLTAALLAAAETGTKTFLDIAAACQHTGVTLETTADTYAQAEHETTAKASAIERGAQ